MAHVFEARAAGNGRASGKSPRWAETTPKIPQDGTLVTFEGANGPETVILAGRELWALRALVAAGTGGVTPIERPAPRWSHYVHQLRALGLEIETLREKHGGAYPGHHGRYVLRSPVAIEGGGHE